MGWRWLLAIAGLFIVWYCLWSYKTVEPFQSSSATSYILEDASGAIIEPDLLVYGERINAIFGTHIIALNIRILNLKSNIGRLNADLYNIRHSDCAGTACTDKCITPVGNNLGWRCDDIQYNLVPNSEKLIEKIQNTIFLAEDAQQNWIDMINTGALNFINDYRDTADSVPTVPIDTRYESASTFDILSSIGNSTLIDAGILAIAGIVADFLDVVATSYNTIINLTGSHTSVGYDSRGNPMTFTNTYNNETMSAIRSAVRSNNINTTLNSVSSAFDVARNKILAAQKIISTFTGGSFRPPPNTDFEGLRKQKAIIDQFPSQISQYLYILTKLNTTLRLPFTTTTRSHAVAVSGALTAVNQQELRQNAALVKRIWLMAPQNLEKYIYVDPATMNAYIRNGAAPTVTILTVAAAQAAVDALNISIDNEKTRYMGAAGLRLDVARSMYLKDNPTVLTAYNTAVANLAIAKAPPWSASMKCEPIYTASAGGSTYTFNTTADGYNKAFCSTQVTPDLLAMLPVPAMEFLSRYIQRRIQTISQITIQSDSEYQLAADAYGRYSTDLSGTSYTVIALGITGKIQRYVSGASNKTKAYLTRMILENTANPATVSATDTAYTSAVAAYNKFKTDLVANPTLSTVSIEGRIATHLKEGNALAKSLFSTMFIINSTDVNAVDSPADVTAAQGALVRYKRDLAGNVVLLAKPMPEKVTTYVGGQPLVVQAYFTIMLQNKSMNIGQLDKSGTDYINAKKAFDNYSAVSADANLSAEQKVTKYLPTGSFLAKTYFTLLVGSTDAERKSFDAIPPLIKPTAFFDNYAKNSQARFDQIAQAFYDFGDGAKAMTYIYDVFPVGGSMLDVRFDLVTNTPPPTAVAQMQALTAEYKAALLTNLSVNQQSKLISNYQTAYGEIRNSIADFSKSPVESGATRRFFYTLSGVSGEKMVINGMANDGMAAGSFHTQYSCGMETPTQDSAGKVNYSPITNFTKNASDRLDCTDKATLIQIGIDYVSALSTDMAYVLKTVSNPWDQNSALYVTKILARQQLTPMSCNLQWEETSFNYISNKPVATRVRTVYVPYVQNNMDWFSTEILFDASGFKYLNTVPEGLTRLATPIVLPPPYIDNQTLDSGGICPKVDCSNPAILYKMIDDYNIIDGNPGVILNVVKATTMNAGQCDLLVDMDYTTRNNPADKTKKGTMREAVSIILSLDIPSCTYNYIDYDIAYGVTDQTPLMKDPSGNVKPFGYIFNFGVNIFGEMSKATNAVKNQISSVYEMAQSALTTYRETTYAALGNIKTFEGCPKIQCHDIDIMSDIFQGYDKKNKFQNRMKKIIQVATNLTLPNTCDVMYENTPVVGWNDASGIPVYGGTQTSAARINFVSDTSSAYGSLFDKQITALRAQTITPAIDAQIKDLEAQKAAIESEVSCSFMVGGITPLLPVKPTAWAAIRDISNALPVLNPSKRDATTFPGMFPYPNPFPSLTVSCGDYKILNQVRAASIETRATKYIPINSVEGSYAKDVIGYSIDSYVDKALTTRDITGSGRITMSPVTVNTYKNVDNQTCVFEMVMSSPQISEPFTVHRQFKFDIDDKLQYTMAPLNAPGSMPPSLTANLPYKEFRDLSGSGLYSGIKGTKPFVLTEATHSYTYNEAPPRKNIPIVNPLPLKVDPVCKLDMRDLKVIAAALGYNGYPKPYQVAAFPATYPDLSNSYEVRITENEYLPFGSTYKIVSFYTSGCNPIVNTFTPSTPLVSQLSSQVGNFSAPENLTAFRAYMVNKPRLQLGRIWKGGYDPKSALYIYSVTMAEYDNDKNIINFYGYPQNNYETNILPFAYVACEFRRRFARPDVTYMASMFVLKAPPTGVVLEIVADPAPKTLDDPFQSMTAYKYLEFTPLAVRSTFRPNNLCQLTRLEFYAGNAMKPVTGSLTGSALTPGATVTTSVTGFNGIFATDGQTVDLTTQTIFISPVGTPILATSTTALKIDGLSFMTGKDPAFDIVKWKLRGSMNGSFWKNLYTSPDLSYPAYGFWRVPMMSFNDMSVGLPQNPNRPRGFIECGGAVNTLALLNQISEFTYNTYSQSYFGTFQAAEKNISRAYLRDLSDALIDDFNNAIYIRAKIDTLDQRYVLTTSSLTFVLTFARPLTCLPAYTPTYSITTTDNLKMVLSRSFQGSTYSNPTAANWATVNVFTVPAFTPIRVELKTGDTVPFAYGGYPRALLKYTNSSIAFDPTTLPPSPITTFMSNGPDRPAMKTLSTTVTSYTNMAPEGAAQMCADNQTCLGFSIGSDGMSGTFVGTPTTSTKLVDSASTASFYVKTGFNLVQYVRVRSLKSASNTVAIAKVGFYKGSSLAIFTINGSACYTINAAGAKAGTVVIGSELANVVDYTKTVGWQATGVDGFQLRFETPLLFDGYTFVTSQLSSASDPVSWIMETSMNGATWLPFDTRTAITPPAARYTAYPLFRPGKESGVSTDFSPKTLTTCGISCTSLLPTLTSTYRLQKNPPHFYVDSIGYDPIRNQCILGWDAATGASRQTGFAFQPTFGDCSNATASTNITINENVSVTGLTRIPDTGPFTYIRFKVTAVNGGPGTHLYFIGFIYRGQLLEPTLVRNVAGTDDSTAPAENVRSTTITNDWKSSGLGHLIITFRPGQSADSFTMITGQDVTCAPVAWLLESSPDGTVWSVLHEQKTPIVPPSRPQTQYQVFPFASGSSPYTAVKGILDKTLQDASKLCSDPDIIGMVNDAAFDQSIFFNPVSYTYDNMRNQCSYAQGSDGSTLIATFSTTYSKDSRYQGYLTRVLNVTSSSARLTGATPFSSGLKDVSDCNIPCDDAALLDAMNSFYSKTNINSNKNPLSATATGFDRNRNECLFQLDDMFAPMDGTGALKIPSKQVGFQIKKNTGCTVPGSAALIINTAVPTGKSMVAPAKPSGSFKFIRFKVTRGGLNIGPFEFFKRGVSMPYTATVTNPLGSVASQQVATRLAAFNDSSVKPLQFAFGSGGLDFDGYSWTTATTSGADPIAWILQASTNGYVWVDLETRTGTPPSDRGFKMPIYGLDGSSTARATAAVKTYSLVERGISCESISAIAITAIAASAASRAIASENGFSADITFSSATDSTVSSENTCKFTFYYNDDIASNTQYTATISYKMVNSAQDKTATIDRILSII